MTNSKCTWGDCPPGYQVDPSRQPVIALNQGSTVHLGGISGLQLSDADGVSVPQTPSTHGNGQKR